MKAAYIQPAIKVRDTNAKSFVICVSPSDTTTQIETDWDNQLGKGRGDIWSSGDNSSDNTDGLW